MALTTNEEQELKYLEVFISNKITRFSSMSFPPAIITVMGGGTDKIIGNFIRDGVVADLYTQEYEFTQVGINRYKILKNKKNGDRINTIAFWIIFFCTLIAAGDVIIKWFKESHSESLPTKSPPQTQEQKANSTSQILSPDSTGIQVISWKSYCTSTNC